MRVLVMGSGAIGGFYGALLHEAGHEVVFVARGPHLEALREHGLELRAASGTRTLAPVHAVAHPAEVDAPIDLVLFAVKTYDTESAIAGVAPAMREDTVLLTFQNGVDGPDLLANGFGAERIVAGVTRVSTTLAEPGVILQRNDLTAIVIGGMAGAGARVNGVAEAFRAAGVAVTVSPHVLVEIWNKFVMLAPQATLTTACDLPAGPIRETPAGRELYEALIAEAVAVARACGAPLAPDAGQQVLRFIDALPYDGTTSLRVGFERRQRVELEHLTGALVRRARLHGVPVPTFETLYRVLTVRALAFHGLG